MEEKDAKLKRSEFKRMGTSIAHEFKILPF